MSPFTKDDVESACDAAIAHVRRSGRQLSDKSVATIKAKAVHVFAGAKRTKKAKAELVFWLDEWIGICVDGERAEKVVEG